MPKEDGRDYEDVHIQGWPNVDDHTVRRYKGPLNKNDELAKAKVKTPGAIAIRRVVDSRSGKILHKGTLESCEGYMWSLYQDDNSNDGLYVWSEIY